MTDFIQFATERGLIIKSLSCDRWVRVPTADHPHKRNGAYFFAGEFGHVQNWATMEQAESWQQDKQRTPFEQSNMARRIEESRKAYAQERLVSNEKASGKARLILNGATPQKHVYLSNKGFSDAIGFVDVDGGLLLPMRDCLTDELTGLQSIRWLMDQRRFEKKMLYGMRARGAVLKIGDRQASETFLCEGYATALSVSAALKRMCLSASVVACFSASNIVTVAERVPGKLYIFADNDKSLAGENAAIKTGLPYCMSDIVGEDANDLHVRAGLLAVCLKIAEVRRTRSGVGYGT